MKLLKLILLFIVTFYANLSFAKDNIAKSENDDGKSGFYAGLYVSPNYIFKPNYRYYYRGVGPGLGGVLAKGMNVGYSLKNLVDFQIGVEYFYKSFSSQRESDQPVSNTSFTYKKATYNVNFYQVPLTVKLFLCKTDKKLRWYFPFGIMYRYQAVDEIISEYHIEDNLVDHISTKMNQQYLYSNFGIGAQYSLLRKINVFVEPNLRFNLLFKDSDETIYRDDNRMYGINIGVNYNLH